jgi:acyl-CoA synthetase (AMP-forming)/AMP-acid ligase II
VTIDWDAPRPLPAEVATQWRADGLWPDTTVSDVITASVDADAIACVVDADRHTFGQLHARSAAVAAALHDGGVRRGDRVLIQLPNGVEVIAAILGCWRLGAIAVPVLPLFRVSETTAALRQTTPSAVIAAADLGGKQSPAAEVDEAADAASVRPLVRLVVGAARDGWSAFPGPIAGAVANFGGFTDPGACALILFTSGTTAAPKGVRHDSRSLLAEMNSYRRGAGLTDGDVVFNPAPIAHIGALVISTLVPWCVGTPVVVLSRWDPASAVAVIEREKVTFAVGAPVFLDELVQRYEAPGYRGHRVSRFQTGAAPTPPALLARADAVGVAAWRAWGMTEAPSISYGSERDALDRRANSDGRVEPGSEVVAVDDTGAVLPPGAEGELLLRSPKQMMGYVEDVDGAVRRDGWLTTGDIGIVDADGWVIVTGRIKDIINRGGEKFSAREIENALCEHPAIAAAAVLGVPEPRLGEQVVAYVTMRAGQGFPGFDALIEHLRGTRIAPQKYPVAITAIEAMPTTATGKVQKPELARLWQGDAR